MILYNDDHSQATRVLPFTRMPQGILSTTLLSCTLWLNLEGSNISHPLKKKRNFSITHSFEGIFFPKTNRWNFFKSSGHEYHIFSTIWPYGGFLKWWYPKRPKMIIFSRKTHGCCVPPFKETTVWFHVRFSPKSLGPSGYHGPTHIPT